MLDHNYDLISALDHSEVKGAREGAKGANILRNY